MSFCDAAFHDQDVSIGLSGYPAGGYQDGGIGLIDDGGPDYVIAAAQCAAFIELSMPNAAMYAYAAFAFGAGAGTGPKSAGSRLWDRAHYMQPKLTQPYRTVGAAIAITSVVCGMKRSVDGRYITGFQPRSFQNCIDIEALPLIAHFG